MDPNAQTFDFFVEGSAVTWTQPSGIGSNVLAGRSLPQSLDWIGFGVESFGGAATTIGGLFDDIVVSGVRVGCGTAPVTTDNPTTSTTDPTTTTSCGYIPQTCGRPLTRMHGLRESKTLGQFEEITGVQLAVATVEDIQLYFHCKGRNPTKCTGLEKPCTCSSPPCTCPGEEPPTSTSASTTSTSISTTTSTIASTSTAAASTSTTPTTTTPGRS